MITAAHDATHQFIGHLPGGQAAGYTTGSPDIRWTNADWDARPGSVRIDQDFAASDPSADVLDVENGAATFTDCPVWAERAKADFAAATRPGQREPAIYFSASNVHNVVNALLNGGVTSGVGLWLADWGIGMDAAIQMVAAAKGPFPIIGVQYQNGTFYDYDVFATAWLTHVSGAHLNGYAHYADGVTTWGEYAAGRGMKGTSFFDEQVKMHPDDAENLIDGMVPVKGARIWTRSP